MAGGTRAYHCRSPDEAPVRSKMLASSSKDALRRRLDGVAAEIQASDYSEITREVGKSTLHCIGRAQLTHLSFREGQPPLKQPAILCRYAVKKVIVEMHQMTSSL